MIDWVSVSSFATAAGTLVLAAATFYSVRSANRMARSSERALLTGLRPVLFPSRVQDPSQKLRWGDDHWALLKGGQAVLEESGGIVYLALSLRNVGAGIGVLHGWRVDCETRQLRPTMDVREMRAGMVRPDPASFRPQSRDIYVPPGDEGFWQAAIRQEEDPDRGWVMDILARKQQLIVDLLYGDQEGGQRTISRFSVTQHPVAPEEWLAAVVRHWYLDRDGPRPGP